MKVKYLLLFVAVAMLSGALNEVSTQSKQSNRQVMEPSSTERNVRITPDLAFYDLRGPVKTLKDANGKTVKFTKDGKLKNEPKGITRDSCGYIIELKTMVENDLGELCLPDDYEYEYNEKGQLITTHNNGFEWWATTRYIYDDKGFVTCYHSHEMGSNYDENWVKTYTYTHVDEYGNWIQREWELVIKEHNGTQRNRKGTDVRIITYYR